MRRLLKQPIKAVVLTEEAELLEQQAFEEACERKLTVPVTMRGRLVGYGTLDKDGSMTVEVESNPEGKALLQLLLNGQANCISMGPNPNSPTSV